MATAKVKAAKAKCILDRKDLANLVKRGGAHARPNNIRQVEQMALLSWGDEGARVSSTDGEVYSSFCIGRGDQDEGEHRALVSGDRLRAIVASLDRDEAVTVTAAKDGGISIRQAWKDYAIRRVVDAEEFPPAPPVRKGVSIPVESGSLASALEVASVATARGKLAASDPIVSGVVLVPAAKAFKAGFDLDPHWEPGQLVAIATDRRRIIAAGIATLSDVGQWPEHGVLVPGKAVEAIVDILEEWSGTVQVTHDGTRVAFTCEDAGEVVARLYEAQPPNLMGLLAPSDSGYTAVPSGNFLAAVRTAASLIVRWASGVAMEVVQGDLRLRGESQEGEARATAQKSEGASADWNGGRATVDPEILADILAAWDGDLRLGVRTDGRVVVASERWVAILQQIAAPGEGE